MSAGQYAFPVTPLGVHLGAEVAVSSIGTLDSQTAKSIVDCVAEYLVVVIRDLTLTAETHIEFTRMLGGAEPHPLHTHRDPAYPELLVLRNNPESPGRRNDIWHSDVTFSATPPAMGVLHALEVPDGRGDTMFCNMTRAYEVLSPVLKDRLRGLSAVHRADHEVLTRTPGVNKQNLAQHLPAGVSHPVIRKHAHTGRPCLFLNPYYVQSLDSFETTESRGLLDYLCTQAIQPENIYRHRWRAGDLLIFDNQATMHYAVHDYQPDMPRLMHRTNVPGAKPLAW